MYDLPEIAFAFLEVCSVVPVSPAVRLSGFEAMEMEDARLFEAGSKFGVMVSFCMSSMFFSGVLHGADTGLLEARDLDTPSSPKLGRIEWERSAGVSGAAFLTFRGFVFVDAPATNSFQAGDSRELGALDACVVTACSKSLFSFRNDASAHRGQE